MEKPQASTTELLSSKNHNADLAAFKNDGIEMCSGCQDKDDGHNVGLKADFEVPADLPLGGNNKLTCLTCHHTHGSLTSNWPLASFTFIYRMVDSERLYKSYLLRRNNAEGELLFNLTRSKKGQICQINAAKFLSTKPSKAVLF